MKLTRHNGRTGKNGVYNPKHNDRQFDIDNSDHINLERAKRKQVPLSVGEIRKNKSIKKEGGDAYGKRSSYLGKE